MNLSIYLITDDAYLKDRDLYRTIEEALEGGVTAVQYRFKKKPTRLMYEELLRIRELTRSFSADLVVNDRVDLALAVDADGVHVGKEDLPPDAVRKVAGNRLYVGYTVNSLQELEEALRLPVDYIGFGSVYPTSTKENYRLVGLQALREAVKISDKPLVAIGGIMPHRIPEVLKTGCRNVALSSGILGFRDVRKAAEEVRRAYRETLRQLTLLGEL
ncbi:MAG TPA: thiamine phosphate synthase [Aquifex aeolicus]|uniref:Thiamine-phosphate synthase n=1 Tax=Aquifex aeolicus TaxID=63363 RepID=A0A7C5Q1B8_AQUAO|nr:thiamine phosphate synthase [Aquifex aeolicus]